MAYTQNKIVIAADIAAVFNTTMDIERWPESFDQYLESRILSRKGNQITFELTTEHGKWQSTSNVDKEHWLITSTRGEPCSPFKYANIRWLYRPVPEGTEMIWEQFFEIDPAADCAITDEEAAERTTMYSQNNMEKIKSIIEKSDIG